MAGALAQVLGLPERRVRPTPAAGDAADPEAYRAALCAEMAPINQGLRALATCLAPAEFADLEARRAKLYEAYQKTSARAANDDPQKQQTAQQRTLEAAKAFGERVTALAQQRRGGLDAWREREPEFDEARLRIDQLQDAGHEKGPALVKVADSIAALAESGEFAKANGALDQFLPKLEALGQQPARHAGAPAGPTRSAAGRPAPFLSGSVGKGGKNNPQDVMAVQEALNIRAGTNLPLSGRVDRPTQQAIEDFQRRLGQFEPDGLVAPRRGPARVLAGETPLPPKPEKPRPIAPPELGVASLDKGAMVWHSTRGILSTNIEELKKGVRSFYGSEHRELLDEIDQSMIKLGSVLDKLDTRLADELDAARSAADAETRSRRLAAAKQIVAEYARYVSSEPLIAHMDKNPFGVSTSLRRIITDALKHLSQLFAAPAGSGERA